MAEQDGLALCVMLGHALGDDEALIVGLVLGNPVSLGDAVSDALEDAEGATLCVPLDVPVVDGVRVIEREPLGDIVMLCDALGESVTETDAESDCVSDADRLLVTLGDDDIDGDELELEPCVHDGVCVSEVVSDCVWLGVSAGLGVPDMLREAVKDDVSVTLPVPDALGDAVTLGLGDDDGDRLVDGVIVPLAELVRLAELEALAVVDWLGDLDPLAVAD